MQAVSGAAMYEAPLDAIEVDVNRILRDHDQKGEGNDYSAVLLSRGPFSLKSSQNKPHSSPPRASYGVSFVSSTFDYVLSQSLQCCKQYHVILDRVI